MTPVAQGLHRRGTYINSRKRDKEGRAAAWAGDGRRQRPGARQRREKGRLCRDGDHYSADSCQLTRMRQPAPVLHRENLNGTAVSTTVHSCFVQFRWDGAECMEQMPKGRKENLFEKGHELFLILDSNCNFQLKISSYHHKAKDEVSYKKYYICDTV